MESKKDVYVISLDAVDLNLLPICQKPYDSRVVPLWSKSNLDLRSNEYYEFEIKTNDTREERNDKVIENVICHICDINVPKVYFNEHKNSFRHKFNAKIADIALRRLQLFMNKDDLNESYEEIPSKHYCPECSLVIDSYDEISHKQSIVHRNSIYFERFLNDFLNFYTNDANEINDSKEDSKISKSDLDSEEENKKINSSSILSNALQVKDEVVGGRFKATELNFNPVTKISSHFEYCVICDQIFAIEKRSLHLNSDLHNENLLQKLPNENCIRKVNDTQNHCILCNYNFNKYVAHVHSKEHTMNFQNMTIHDERKRTAENLNNFNAHKTNVDTKSYSDIVKSNKSESSTATNGYKAPLNNKTVKNSNILPRPSLSVDISGKLFCDSCNVWISDKKMKKHQNTMKHTLNTMTDYHYLLKYLDKDNLCCKICDVTVSNIFNDIINHFTNLDHIDKYDKLLQAHYITKRDKTTYYCKKCKVYILHKNEYLHIESKQHKDKISLIQTEDIDEYTDKVETDNAVNVELDNGYAIKTVEPSNAVNVELGNSNAIKSIEPGDAVQIGLGNGNAIGTVELGDAVKIELSNGNANETVESSNAVNIELDNGNAIKTVEPSNAVNVELGHDNANKTVEPGNAVNVELDNSNAIKSIEPGDAVNVEVGHVNANKTVEPGNAVKIELSNGNANETVESSNAVNIELDNGNDIKTVEPSNAVNVELGHDNANKTVKPGNAVNVELDNSNAIKSIEPGDAVNVEVGHVNANKTVEPGNAVKIELSNGNANETVESSNAVNIELDNGNAIETVEPSNVVNVELGHDNANKTVKPGNAVNVELDNSNAIKSIEPGDAVNVEVGHVNANKTVEPGNAVKIELSNGNANETVESSNAVNIELDNGNAIKTVEPSNAFNVELGHDNANKTVEPANAVNVELDNSNAIKSIEPGDDVNVEVGHVNANKTVVPGNAVNVELGNSNTIKSTEPGDAVNVEVDNGNAIKSVEPGNIVNVELDNCNAIETVEPGNAVQIKLGNGNAIETVEPGNAVQIKLGNGDAIETVEPDNAVNVELDNCNAIETVEPGNAVQIGLGNGNAIGTVELGDAVNVELGNSNAFKSVEPGNTVNVELDHGTIKTVEPSNAIDNKVVDAANSKALERVDKCGPSTSKDIRTFQPESVREINETPKQSENTVKPVLNSYFCKVCQVQVLNNVNNILAHNKGRLHMSKLKLRPPVDTKVKETSNMHYQMVETNTKNVVICMLCHVSLTFNDKNISTHVEGETHKNNYSEFCKRNLLVALNNGMYCLVCGVNPGIRCEITHCIGRNHKKNLENVS